MTLQGKKTYIIGAVALLLGGTEMAGIIDWPFVEDPMGMIQIGLASMTLRAGIGKPKQEM